MNIARLNIARQPLWTLANSHLATSSERAKLAAHPSFVAITGNAMNREEAGAFDEWLALLGVGPENNHWSVGFRLSTVQIESWFYQRNKLRPEDIKLDLTVDSGGLWCASLARHDELFLAQWRPNGDFRVESEQMKYRRLVKWPALASLREFPSLVQDVERTLGIRFIRHADVGASGYVDIDRWVSERGDRIRDWLAPCADTIGTYLRSSNNDHG